MIVTGGVVRMRLKQRRLVSESMPKKASKQQRKLFWTLFSTAKTVSNRNPQSRGQGLSGESKVAIMQLLHEDKD